MATRPATAPEAMPSTLGLPLLNHSANIQLKRGSAGRHLRHQHRHAGAAVRGRRRAGIETEPPHPEERCADQRQRQIVGRHCFAAVPQSLAEHQAAGETGDAGIDVHDGAAGVVENACRIQPAAGLPHHVRDRARTPAATSAAMNTSIAENFMRSANAPAISAGVMIGKGHLKHRIHGFREWSEPDAKRTSLLIGVAMHVAHAVEERTARCRPMNSLPGVNAHE